MKINSTTTTKRSERQITGICINWKILLLENNQNDDVWKNCFRLRIVVVNV